MPLDRRMLDELGIGSVEELFFDIPEEVRTDGIPLSPGKSEMEVVRYMQELLSANLTAESAPCFLGGGVYHHFIPSAVGTIVSRSELATSYTPYQAEISQGMLQSLFEYQSYIAELTAMDAVNSSNYDWATALGEAATMCHRILPKRTFLDVWRATVSLVDPDPAYRTPVPLGLIRGADDRTGNIATAMPRWAAAEGVTEVSGGTLVDRGYEDITGKLTALGADFDVVD